MIAVRGLHGALAVILFLVLLGFISGASPVRFETVPKASVALPLGSGQNVVVKRQSLKPLAVRQEQQPL